MSTAVLKPHSESFDPEKESKDSWTFQEGDEIYPGRFSLRLLGGGKRYEAYLSYDETLLSPVVIKILRPSRIGDPASLEVLKSEFRALRTVNHPVISRAFGAVLDGERPHIILEYLEGPRLSSLIRKFGPLPMEQVIPLAVQLCSALHYMHGRGMVHLDVKPKNVIMAAPPRLIDLSIARSFAEAAKLRVPVGSDAYMAPEQCVPGAGVDVGAAADVWGLGVTLYEAANGGLPFAKRAHASDPYPQCELKPQPFEAPVPIALAELIEDCLRKAPQSRPTPRELSESLEPLVAALPRRVLLGRLRPRWK